MNYDFDFNINNYCIGDLENFFTLNENYTLNDINEKCSKINTIIFESKDYDKIHKTQLETFLEKAKIKLINGIKNISKDDNGFIKDYNKLLIDKDNDYVVNQTSTTYAGNTFVMNPEKISLNHVISPEKKLEPIESYPTLISKSNLNNLKRKTILQTVVLNTLFREDYYKTSSTDFTILLPYYFKNVLSLKLSSLQLPNVIYCISKYNGNNYFYIEEDATGINGKIIFPDGNYNEINEFASLLQTTINKQLGISPDRFIVNYDINTNKITISNTLSNFSLIFNESIDNINNNYKVYEPTKGQRQQDCVPIEEIYKKFGWIVGYRSGSYYGNNNYTTEGVYNGAYPNYIYFVLNDYNNSQAQNVFGMYSKSIIGDNILGMIPITSQNFFINFTNGSDFIERKREYFGPVRIQRLKIQLLNQYGDIINLNNMDYSFTLELEIGYDI